MQSISVSELLERIPPDDVESRVTHFTGVAVRGEAEDTLKIYTQPNLFNNYIVISIEDIVGEILEIPASESVSLGFIGKAVYQIGVRNGARVKVVQISSAVVGAAPDLLELSEDLDIRRPLGPLGPDKCPARA